MATVHIDINLLTEELAIELGKLGRALTAIELHHFVMDKIGEKYPQMQQGIASRLTHEVLSTMNAYRFEADERAKRQQKNNPFNNRYGRKYTTTDWNDFMEYNRQDIKAEQEFNQRMHEAYVNGHWGGDGDAPDNEEGAVDFDEEELIDAFSYAGVMWKARKDWNAYRLSRGDFMGGFTRIRAGARINSRVFEAIPFEMIKR